MKTTKTIEITGVEMLEYFISVSENCTISEARTIIRKSDVHWDIKDNREHEWENKFSLNKVTVTINK